MYSPKVSRRIPFLSLTFAAALVTLVLTNPAQAQSQLVCSPCSINFGNVAVGGSQAVEVDFTNSGSSPITVKSETRTGPWFFYRRGVSVPFTVAAGQTVTFNLIFAPSSNKTSTGAFTYTSNASNPSLAVAVTGTGVAAGTLAANPTSLGFGRVAVGASSTKTITVSNPGKSSITINQTSELGGALASPFNISGLTTPLTLAGGQSFTFQVTFAPKSLGDFIGNVSLVSSTGAQISVAENGVGATGTAAGVLSVSPATVNFGNVTVGSSQSQTITLSAASNSVTVTADSLGSAEYSLSGLTLPLTLTAGQSVGATVTFSPQASGAANTSLAFTTASGSTTSADTTSNSTASTSLVGTGVAAKSYSVALSWQPSTSDVAGYNVYRGSQQNGPYSKINSSTDGATSFSDGSVQGGNSYYYQVTSVDSNGMESAPTAPVAATVPAS